MKYKKIKLTKQPQSETILWEEMTEREKMIYDAGYEDGNNWMGGLTVVILLFVLVIFIISKYLTNHQ